eukprot:scaffold34685_cov183-Amphora_coffeaeformis.AAC.25
MDHQNNEESPVRIGNNISNAVVTPSASSANNNKHDNNAVPPSSSSPSLLHNSQSLPIVPSHNKYQQWNSPMNHNDHHLHHQEESMDGLRVTTLVGLGGLIGWTAAAAYRWLNGGEFSMLPPPLTTSMDMGSSSERIPNTTNNNQAFPMSPLERQGQVVPTPWNNHHHPNGDDNDTVGRVKSSHDELSKQVQNLVEALQKQSTEHREIMKRLSQQSNARQTNESMQRLRAAEQQQQQQTTQNSSTATQLAIFCKLAEIQAELSSLRRDVQSLPERADKWDQRLSSTLEQVESCLDKLKIKAHADDTADTALNTTTPVRTKIVWSSDTSNHDEDGSMKKSDDGTSSGEAGVHAVASALRQIVLENDITTVRVSAQMLYMYTINLANQPGIPRYRKIFTSNESFGRVDKLKGGREVLRAVGFQDRDNVLEWEPGKEEDRYLSLLNEVSTALGVLKSPGQATSAELLEKALSCLSLSVGTPASRSENNKGGSSSSDDTLPAVYKTPDPSILSPPATKKQALPADAATVNFSPPRIDVPSTGSATGGSFFTDDNNSNDKDVQTIPMEDMADTDSVWK